MLSLPRSGRRGIRLLLGVVPPLALATFALAGPATARAPSRCSAPPHAGADYSRCQLAGFDFAGADLAGATFQRATLTGVNFTGTGLIDANLTKATVTGARLGSADLTGATLTDVVSGGIGGAPATLPSGWVLTDGYLIGPQANLTGANLTGANLTGGDLFKANLTGATFSGANLTGATLKRSNLQGTVLGGATLTDLVSGGAIVGTPASLPPGWALVGTNVRYLVGPTANLTNADLYGANLTGADLLDANMTGADLFDAILTNANLQGTMLSGANLVGVVSGGITGTPASLPAGWSLVGGYLVMS